jgi:RNA polymerase sigma-70 factor, ECF subfamily
MQQRNRMTRPPDICDFAQADGRSLGGYPARQGAKPTLGLTESLSTVRLGPCLAASRQPIVVFSRPGTAKFTMAEQHEVGVNTPDQFKSDILSLLPRLRRFGLSLTRSGADADDLVQDAYAAALTKWHQFDPSQHLDRWMFRIVRNLWISELRKRKVRQGEGTIPAEDATELRTDTDAEDAMLARQVRGQVDALPADLAQPLLLVCAEGYSYREAADLLDIPIGTVMSRIHRARKILMAGLGEKERAAL